MARRNFQSTDWIQFLDTAWPTTGTQDFEDSTTCTIALSIIAATDIISTQVIGFATTCYVTEVAITAGTGFIVTVNQDPGKGATLSYVVHKVNS